MKKIITAIITAGILLTSCNSGDNQSKTTTEQTETPQEKQITLQEVQNTDTATTENPETQNNATENNSETPQKTIEEVRDEKGQVKGTVKKIYTDPEAKKILESPIEIYNPIDDPDPTPDPSPSEFVLVDKEPVLLNWNKLKKQIKKPEGVNAKGTVYLKVLISKKGFYRGHVIRKSPHPKLSMAVVEQVKKIKAIPAKKDGKPVKVWVNLSYEFK